MSTNDKIYEWADMQLSAGYHSDIGFTMLFEENPCFVDPKIFVSIKKNASIIRRFQDICIKLFRDSLSESGDKTIRHWLINETLDSYGLEYHRNLSDKHYTRPVFFRTDEPTLGKIAEIQCPGSLWGEMQLAYEYFQAKLSLKEPLPAEVFSKQLTEYLRTQPIIHYLTDNASSPIGVRYFIEKTRQFLKYYGIDKNVTPRKIPNKESGNAEIIMPCNFVRTHSFYGLVGDNYFWERLPLAGEEIMFDFPPNILFDQKATLVLPFWDRTRDYFDEEIRNLLIYTTPILPDGVTLEDGQHYSLDEFCQLPRSKRRYYAKYAGTDVTINWGSKAVERLDNKITDCREVMNKAVRMFDKGEIWLLQTSVGDKEDVRIIERNGQLKNDCTSSKYSLFYGPFGLIGTLCMHRHHYKVHGQKNTSLSCIIPL